MPDPVPAQQQLNHRPRAARYGPSARRDLSARRGPFARRGPPGGLIHSLL
ncbi:hypothetical protein ACWD69_10400 [Micromonospora chokoriensis]